MSEGPMGVLSPELEETLAKDIAAVRDDARRSNVIPFERTSPLDKNAHLRRTVEEHHEALQVHQHVLQGHAQLHGAHAERTATLKNVVDARLEALEKILDRGLLGRLCWLLTGK